MGFFGGSRPWHASCRQGLIQTLGTLRILCEIWTLRSVIGEWVGEIGSGSLSIRFEFGGCVSNYRVTKLLPVWSERLWP